MSLDSAPPDRHPLVTVAMPVFNAGPYLRPAVLSIVGQTLADWELLLIDDGSDDGAIDGVAALGDPRIRIVRDGHHTGIAERLNQAIDIARGRYFARMDADDFSHPERLARQAAALQANPALDLLATRAVLIDAGHQLRGEFPHALSHRDICARPWLGFHFPHPTWMGSIDWFRAHRYAVPAPFRCEDQELLLRCHLTSCFATLDAPLLAYRIPGQTDWRKRARTRRATVGYQSRHYLERREWHLAALASLAWLGKSGLDAWRKWTRRPVSHEGLALPTDVQQRWRELLDAGHAPVRR